MCVQFFWHYHISFNEFFQFLRFSYMYKHFYFFQKIVSLFCRFLIQNALLPRATIGTKNASIVSNVAPRWIPKLITPMKEQIRKFIASLVSKRLFPIMKCPKFSTTRPLLNQLNPRVVVQDVMELCFKLRKSISKEECIIKNVFLVNNARDWLTFL